jgi:hypothetical protein
VITELFGDASLVLLLFGVAVVFLVFELFDLCAQLRDCIVLGRASLAGIARRPKPRTLLTTHHV